MAPSFPSAGEAYNYAFDIVKGRWREGEGYIMKDPCLAYRYACHIIKDRWPEAEPYIKRDPEYAYYYACDTIKDRWPEAESYIAWNSYWYERYVKYVVKKYG